MNDDWGCEGNSPAILHICCTRQERALILQGNAERQEADVVEDELHDALRRTGIAPALVLAQAAAGRSIFSQPRGFDFRRDKRGRRGPRGVNATPRTSNWRP